MTDQRLSVTTITGDGPILAAVPSIGENLRRIRLAAGMTHQGQFAEMIGVPQSRLSDWERGRWSPEVANLIKIATALGCSIDDLLAGVDPNYDALRSDLIRQTRDGESSPGTKPEGIDGKSTARLLAEAREDGRRAALEEVGEVIEAFAAEIAGLASAEDTPARRKEAHSRRAHRARR